MAPDKDAAPNELLKHAGDDKEKEEEEGEDGEEEKDSAMLDLDIQEMEIFKVETFDEADFPESYKRNNSSEVKLLSVVENFCRQYYRLYKDRKTLFITPPNEFGVEKFVCSTLRPIELPLTQLSDWQGVSAFVADYLHYIPLKPCHQLPTHLYSPSTTLALQKGTSFEYSSLLASLLIGLGYDAYVVSGYASRKVCMVDEEDDECPLLMEKKEAEPPPIVRPPNKYFDKPMALLRESTERKRLGGMRTADESKLDAKSSNQPPYNQPISNQPTSPKPTSLQSNLSLPASSVPGRTISDLIEEDELHGLRVHAWVLVLRGKMDEDKDFFLEPTTGLAHPIRSESYLGIENIWNDKNMWVCMQECSEGIKDLKYNLSNLAHWEYVLHTHKDPPAQEPAATGLTLLRDLNQDAHDNDAQLLKRRQDFEETHIEMPVSWTKPIVITLDDLVQQCPNGKKVILYKRSKVEKFAAYDQSDGLVLRLTQFEDLERQNILYIREIFKHRLDKLHMRCYDYKKEEVSEFFLPGKPNKLKEHHYKLNLPMQQFSAEASSHQNLNGRSILKSNLKNNLLSKLHPDPTANYTAFAASTATDGTRDGDTEYGASLRKSRVEGGKSIRIDTRPTIVGNESKASKKKDKAGSLKVSQKASVNFNENHPATPASFTDEAVATTTANIDASQPLAASLKLETSMSRDEPSFYRSVVRNMMKLPGFSIEEFPPHRTSPDKGPLRVSVFYSSYRPDSLSRRIERKYSTEEHYDDRDDLMHYKFVEYDSSGKKAPVSSDYFADTRKVNKIVVRYRKSGAQVHKFLDEMPSSNKSDGLQGVDSEEDATHPSESFPAPVDYDYYRFTDDEFSIDKNNDISEITFNILTERITVVYHRDYNRISATTREFMKPSRSEDKGKATLWHPDSNYTVYLSDPAKRDKKKVTLYQLMLQLLKMEEKYEIMNKESQMEVLTMLEDRLKEENNIVLEHSTLKAVQEKAQKRREMLERMEREEQGEEEKKELDLISMVLLKETSLDNLSKEKIADIKTECLSELKKRMVARTNLIQERYDKETAELQRRQQRFQQNQMVMTKKDEQEYTLYCSEAMFRIQILEMRLNRNNELAPLRYRLLEEKLATDARINRLSSTSARSVSGAAEKEALKKGKKK